MLLGFLFLLGLFVAVFAVINQPAYGGIGTCSNFYQVHGMLTGKVNGISKSHDSELITFRADNPHLTGTNFPVNSYE